MSKQIVILGISCFYHDSAAALVVDGEIIAAAQEERFSRKKHDPRFPINAINYCLEEGKINNNEIDAIAFYDNPIKSFDRVLNSLIAGQPSSKEQWDQMCLPLVAYKLFVESKVENFFNRKIPVLYSEHHFSHASSAFFPSPFNRAAILTIDGVGEWATTTIGFGRCERIEILKEINYPNSLGLLYSAFTYYCGFKINSGEYKLMGLAPYGTPIYKDVIYKHLVEVKEDGSYKLNMNYFAYVHSHKMVDANFEELFGGPPRKSESRITRKEMDIAASIQAVTEEIVFGLARHSKNLTGEKNLVLAGGVALNCVSNGKLLREKIFDKIWIQPASGDAGGALGAAMLVSHSYFNVKRELKDNESDKQKGSLLGISFSNREILAFINTYGLIAEKVDEIQRGKEIAQLLAEQKIIGYFSGRMEFGPRSLGARSIIADPRSVSMQSTMNLKIKFRESFRPFAPSVLRERVSDYFELDEESPYMLLVADVKPEIRKKVALQKNSDDMVEILNISRSLIPAVTHVDYSARVQTVDENMNPKFYKVLKEFDKLTGCGVLVNTSFNVRGEPVVCSPKDAYRCFMRTDMDFLVLEDYIFDKNKQPKISEIENWRDEYELD
jgi:carbamoyltransferase